MTAKEYLMQYGQAKTRVKNLNDTLNQVRSDAGSIRGVDYSQPKVQHSHSDTSADTAVKIEALEAEAVRAVLDAEKLMLEITLKIIQIESAEYMRILYDRYILGRSLNVIADSMHYSYVHTCRLHGQALQEFANCFSLNTIED